MKTQNYRYELFQSRQVCRLFQTVKLMLLLVPIAALNLTDTRAQGAGSLDTTFGTGGKVKTAFRVDRGGALASVIQPDGKIIAAGYNGCDLPISCPTAFSIVRFNIDGTPDLSFGNGGKVVTDFGGIDDGIRALALQTGGKIVAVGTTRTSTNSDFAIARYNTDGTLDNSFDGDGKLNFSFSGTSNEQARGVAIDSGGKIYVVGDIINTSPSIGIYLRLNTDGSVDTFGTISTASYPNITPAAIAIQPWDNKIVIGGRNVLPNFEFLVIRLLPSGVLDAGFGVGGVANADFSGNSNTLNALALDPVDRSIITAGESFSFGDSIRRFAIAKFDSAGSLVSGFGTGGKVTVLIGTIGCEATSVQIQTDRKIIVAGYARRSTSMPSIDFAVIRLLTNGVIDPTFGILGETTTAINNNAEAFSVALQTDGKIILAGRANTSNSLPSPSGFALTRYNSNGVLDSTFNSNGIVITVLGSEERANATLVQPDGKIVVAGSTDESRFNNREDFALTRYNANGTLDTTFGTGGRVQTDFSGRSDEALAAAIQTDGKIVVAGRSLGGVLYDFALARYNTDGTLDATFGSGGKVITDFGSNSESATAVAIQSDGMIVVAGNIRRAGTLDNFAVIRYQTNGLRDMSFAVGGLAETDFGSTNDTASAVKIQPDGKIVAVGTTKTTTGTLGDFAVARYKIDGGLDASFNAVGTKTISIGTDDEEGFALAIETGGNLVIAGSSSAGSSRKFALARVKTDGNLDGAFGVGGTATFGFPSGTAFATSVAIQTDGKIIAAGSALGSPPEFAVMRINNDGSPDTSFDSDGRVLTDFGGSDVAASVAIQADGKIVAAGYSESNSDYDFALARYNVLTPTAANASISGRVTTAEGRGIRNARLILTNSSGETHFVQTGPFGFFRFNDLPVGETYVLTVYSKRFIFAVPSQVINLNDDLTNVNFTAEP